jgi:putative endonuclease
MFYVYILQSSNGQFYTGCTSDLKRRLLEHNSGKSTYTSYRGPYELLYYEACLDSKDAYAREKYLKTGMGKRYIKNRIKHYLGGRMNPVKTQKIADSTYATEQQTRLQSSTNNGKVSGF